MCEIYVASAEILQPKCIIKQEIDSKYKLIILRKFLLFTVLLKHLTEYFTQQYWHVQFSVKLFDTKIVNENDFLKFITLLKDSAMALVYAAVIFQTPLS